jgi:hypothetical protein
MGDRSESYKKWASKPENRKRILERSKEYYYANREKMIKVSSEWRKSNITSWDGIIGTRKTCEVCNKEILFNCGDKRKTIHFDHKHGGSEAIKDNPSTWLRNNKYTEENKRIWDSCRFGLVCESCNKFMPTLNRKEWWLSVGKYMGYVV